MNGYVRLANQVGLFFVFLFIICFVWYFVRSAEAELHLALLRLSFFGYSGMNILSFISGAIQSYIWGYIGVAVWVLSAKCCKK